jgi:uncharacterized protein (TIGR00255 family)
MVKTAPAKSMTGYATLKGGLEDWDWTWEIRSVNGRGLDIRLRLPDWIEGLEPLVRSALAAAQTRGNVTLSLKISQDRQSMSTDLDIAALSRAMDALTIVESLAHERGLSLAVPSMAEVLALRGVMDNLTEAADIDPAPLLKALTAELPVLIVSFDQMRSSEGQVLTKVLISQLDRIEALTTDAKIASEARKGQVATVLRENVTRILANADGIDEGRLSQELALLAVKADVSEELDRLAAHVTAARTILAVSEPVGRKLDFLSQEFMREANTLCSKSQSTDLTRIGLDLKVVIDQMREQVQNME